MFKKLAGISAALIIFLFLAGNFKAVLAGVDAEPVLDKVNPLIIPFKDREELSKLKPLINNKELGPVVVSPLKHAVRNAANAGVPIDTIVLLLLLPAVATVIAAARHLVGLQSFGILMPAALSVAFVATGPIVGMGLFLVIVFVSTAFRIALRRLKVKLQYLPRMALIVWLVVLGVVGALFSLPILTNNPYISNVSVFPVLVLILLAEDFARVQLGKSIRVAISLTTETLFLALIAFAIFELRFLQRFALTNPEILFIFVALADVFLGRYTGLRLLELWRFRRLIFSK